jgi:hypothetical protein
MHFLAYTKKTVNAEAMIVEPISGFLKGWTSNANTLLIIAEPVVAFNNLNVFEPGIVFDCVTEIVGD